MNTDKTYIVAAVTPQLECENIIETAKEFAERMNAELLVVTIQPKKATATKRSQDIKALTALASRTTMPITVRYSDYPAISVATAVSEQNTLHIFTGSPGNTDFIKKLSALCANIPISVVVGRSAYNVCPAV